MYLSVCLSVSLSLCLSVSVCLSVRELDVFLKNGSLVLFSDLWYNGRKLEYLKTDRAFFFSKKIHFCTDLAKKGPKWFLLDFLKTVISFLGNNLRETSIVVDILSLILYLAKFWFRSYGPKCCQSNCRIFKNKIS